MITRRTGVAAVARPLRQRGLTLLEILIALVILSIGLLGLTALQTASLQFNTSAYYRTQATVLAYDFADRMRANRDAALDGDYNTNATAAVTCDPGLDNDGSPAEEIAAWQNALACRLPLGRGQVAVTANDRVTITVRWDDGRGEQVALTAAFEVTTTL